MPATLLSPPRPLQWDATSRDYLAYRPGYPEKFFTLLHVLGVGLSGQAILDLGTGTGALSIPFARQGAQVTATDSSADQIQAARDHAARHGLDITFKVAPAEETGFKDHAFDVVTASMCWGYFKIDRMLQEVPRLLRPSGLLVLSSLLWVHGRDPIAIHSEALIEKYNEEARRPQHDRNPEIIPNWSKEQFRLTTYSEFITPLPFTQESWRGRIRASKFILAALSPENALAFDREHEEILNKVAPPTFEIPHLIKLHLFQLT